MWYVYTMEYYSATKKNKIMPFAAMQMELETLILREASQKEKEIPFAIIYMWNLIYGTGGPIHKTEIDSQT